jgi:hypothetical protein
LVSQELEKASSLKRLLTWPNDLSLPMVLVLPQLV